MEKVKILGISGSLRKGSFNTALLRVARDLAPDNITIEIFDLAGIPLYNEDVRKTAEPPAVTELKGRIAAADALLLAVPEYNYSVSGVLKNAIDWASRPPATSPLNGKPLGMMGAGGGLGTARAQYHMRQIAVFTNMFPLNRPEVFVPRAVEKFDEAGNLLDEQLKSRIADLVTALADWAMRLK